MSEQQMAEVNETVANVEQSEVPTVDTENATDGGETTVELKRKYFGPQSLQSEGVPYINAVQAIDGLEIKRNFDPEAPFPANYGLAVIPISKRVNEQNKIVACAVCAMPDPSAVSQDQAGQDFIRRAVIDTFMNKLANSFRERQDGSVAASAPFTIEDFITSRRRGESLKAYTTLAPHFVKALKKKGLSFLTTQLLRQMLQSAQFAGSIASTVPQEQWVKVLDALIVQAGAHDLDPAIFETWKATRDETQQASISDDDFSDLEDMEIED